MTGSRAALREWALVALAFAALATVALVWLARDRRPPEWDHANHLERVLRCEEDIASGDARAILERSTFYPPLVSCAAALLDRRWPSDGATAQIVVLVFLGVGMAAVHLLARAVAGGPEGVIAAIVFGTAPFVIFSSLRFQLDLPLAAMVALTVLALVRSEAFERRGASLALGVLLGLGMLTKPPFAAYVLTPLVLVGARVRSRRGLAHLGLALLLGLALALPWYGPRLFGLLPDVGARAFRQAAESGHPAPLTAEALAFYPRWLVPLFGALPALLALLGAAVALVRGRWLPLTTALVPLALLGLIQNKNLRYVLPLLPFLAVLVALGLSVTRGRLRALARGAVVAGAALHVSATAFGVPPAPRLPGLDVPLLLVSQPDRRDWRHREILARIVRDPHGADVTVSVVPNDNYFSVSNFRYYAVRDRAPIRWSRAWDGEPIGVDYMILKTGDQGPSWTARKPRLIMERLAADPYLARVYPVVGAWDLPDGSTATLRARRVDPEPDVPPAQLGRIAEEAVRRRLAEVARDVEELEVRVTHDDTIRRGHLERVEISARAATVGELTRPRTATLRVHDLTLIFDDVLINPWSLAAEGRLDPLDAGAIRLPRARILAADLTAFLRQEKGFRHAALVLETGAIAFRFSQLGPDVSGVARILPASSRPFELAFDRVRVAGLPVPGGLVNWVVRGYDPSLRLASRLPVPVTIGRVEVGTDAVRIVPNP